MHYFDYKESKPHGSVDFPFELYHIDRHHPQYAMPFHWHVEYEIIRILEGEFFIFLDDTKWHAKAGDIIFIRDGIIHGGTPENCIYECIVFDINTLIKPKDICKNYMQKIIKHSVFINSFFKNGSPIQNVIWSLFEIMQKKFPGYELITEGYLYQFFGICFEYSFFYTPTAQTARSHRRLLQFKQVLEYIENYYASPITLNDLAKISGMSPKYFCHYFKELMHKTPIDYLNYYRIERACYLLSTSNQKITEVAFHCGFNDISYFIKTFKKYKGITPKKYSSC